MFVVFVDLSFFQKLQAFAEYVDDEHFTCMFLLLKWQQKWIKEELCRVGSTAKIVSWPHLSFVQFNHFKSFQNTGHGFLTSIRTKLASHSTL